MIYVMIHAVKGEHAPPNSLFDLLLRAKLRYGDDIAKTPRTGDVAMARATSYYGNERDNLKGQSYILQA